MKGTSKQEVDKVTITRNNTTMEYTTQGTMENALFIEGTRRFSQTENEPPMQKHLIDLIGYWGQKAGAQQILDGTFDSSIANKKI